jgi:hypothetical protein
MALRAKRCWADPAQHPTLEGLKREFAAVTRQLFKGQVKREVVTYLGVFSDPVARMRPERSFSRRWRRRCRVRHRGGLTRMPTRNTSGTRRRRGVRCSIGEGRSRGRPACHPGFEALHAGADPNAEAGKGTLHGIGLFGPG